MDFNAVWMFVKVVQAGSFSAAARQIRVPKSTVSKRVAELEDRLQLTLLRRTTRQLQLTDAGRSFYEKCAHAFVELQDAEKVAVDGQPEPSGLLRITIPIDMSTETLASLLSEFMEAHPKVQIEVVLTDRVLDLLADSIDIALRVGELADSSLVARRISMSRFQLFASPKYLKGRELPKIPADVASLECLRFTGGDLKDRWELRAGAKRARLQIHGRFTANHLGSIRSMTIEGLGVGLLPTFACREDVNQGTLIPLLPDWSTEDDPIHLVHPAQKFTPLKVKAFMEFMGTRLKQLFELPEAQITSSKPSRNSLTR